MADNADELEQRVKRLEQEVVAASALIGFIIGELALHHDAEFADKVRKAMAAAATIAQAEPDIFVAVEKILRQVMAEINKPPPLGA